MTATVDVDGESAREGLMALVVAVVEILVEALEREAIRRMESGTLTDEEIDRLGTQLATLEAELDALKADEGIESNVAALRGDLNDVVEDAVRGFEYRHSGADAPPSPGFDAGSTAAPDREGPSR